MNRLNNPKFLKAFYKFNGNVRDFSGNGNNGTAVGTESYTPTLFGKSAYLFSTTSTNVTVPDSSSFSFGTGNFTMAGWVKVNALPAVLNVLMTKGNAMNGMPGFTITTDSIGRIGWIGTGTAHLRATTACTVGKWHHIAFVRDGTNYNIYLDGVLDVTRSATAGDITIASQLIFGRDVFAVYGNSGNISDFRFYNIALTLTEVQKLYRESLPNNVGVSLPLDNLPDLSDTSLKASWLNKENSGTLNDYSGTNSAGTATNIRYEKVGAYFNTSEANFGNIIQRGTGSLTVSGYVKTSASQSNYNGLVTKTLGGSGNRWAVYLFDNKLSALASTTTTVVTTDTLGTKTLNDGAWHRFDVVFNRAGNLSCYVDGALDSSTSMSTIVGENITAAYDLTVGRYTGTKLYLVSANLKNIEIYNEAKSADWVRLNYLKNVPEDDLVLSTTDGIKSLTNKNTLTNNGAVVGNGIVCDGSAGKYVATNFTIPLAQSEFTFVCIAKSNAMGTWQGLINSHTQNYLEFMDNGAIRFLCYDNVPSAKIVVSSVLLANKIYHIVGTVSKVTGKIILYIDGVQVAEGVYGTNDFRSLSAHNLGAAVPDSRWLNGKIYDARVYSTAKSADWVKQDYAKAIRYW